MMKKNVFKSKEKELKLSTCLSLACLELGITWSPSFKDFAYASISQDLFQHMGSYSTENTRPSIKPLFVDDWGDDENNNYNSFLRKLRLFISHRLVTLFIRDWKNK
ncbi:hypothetical protein CHS0354_023165 [Potamilus streckersoni]|uniref:Uncharacterized protein n=1 Tax=Potamilus streckersoni TaxID=2493646 RepID=A0AAE0VH36_9BIVA|nr:hypothetical protein CHS0354_023165 [Potamilus streckersoni]